MISIPQDNEAAQKEENIHLFEEMNEQNIKNGEENLMESSEKKREQGEKMPKAVGIKTGTHLG